MPHASKHTLNDSSPSATKTLRLIGLTRKSKGEDEGTHRDQTRLINEHVARYDDLALLGGKTTKEHKVSGAKRWRDREIGQAILDASEKGHCPEHRFDPCPADCAATWVPRKAEGIIVAWTDRITRERLLAAAEIWEAFEERGIVFISTNGADSRREDAEFSFGIEALLARRQWKTIQKRSNMGRERSVVENGVHGGDTPPLGYEWTWIVTTKANGDERKAHGPLTPSKDARKITEAFERYANDDAAWSQVVALLGLKSIGNARSILTNRVYLGEAKSGDCVNANHDGSLDSQGYGRTHPPLVSREVFDAVQRRLARQSEDKANTTRAPSTPSPLAKVYRCAVCGGVATPDHSTRRGKRFTYLRCKKATQGLCDGGGSISQDVALPYALTQAQAWHEQHHPLFMLDRDSSDAVRPALTDTLAEVDATLAALKGSLDEGTIDPITYAEAASPARKKQAEIRLALDEADAALGWMGQSPEKVAERLAEGDAEVINSFLRDMVRIVLAPVGKKKATKVARAPENRCKVLFLVGGRTASDESPDTFLPERVKKGETWEPWTLPAAPEVEGTCQATVIEEQEDPTSTEREAEANRLAFAAGEGPVAS